MHTHPKKEIATSGVDIHTNPCPGKLPSSEMSTVHLSQPQMTRKVASLFSARFLEESADTLCPILRFARGRGHWAKPCEGNVIAPASQRSDCCWSHSWPIKGGKHSLVSSLSQEENQSVSNLQVQKFKSGQKKNYFTSFFFFSHLISQKTVLLTTQLSFQCQ